MIEKNIWEKAFNLLSELRKLGFDMEHIPMEKYETWIIHKDKGPFIGLQVIKPNHYPHFPGNIFAKTYVHKPTIVRAVQVTERDCFGGKSFSADSKEGILYGKAGDYLIEGTEGEIWIVDKDIFEKTYKLEKK